MYSILAILGLNTVYRQGLKAPRHFRIEGFLIDQNEQSEFKEYLMKCRRRF